MVMTDLESGNLERARTRDTHGKQSRRPPASIRDLSLWARGDLRSSRPGPDDASAKRDFNGWIHIPLHSRGGKRVVRWKVARRPRGCSQRPGGRLFFHSPDSFFRSESRVFTDIR